MLYRFLPEVQAEVYTSLGPDYMLHPLVFPGQAMSLFFLRSSHRLQVTTLAQTSDHIPVLPEVHL